MDENKKGTAEPQLAPPPLSHAAPLPPNAGMVNGRPYVPPAPTPGGQFGQLSGDKPPRGRWFFIIIGILQAGGVGLFLLVMLWASAQAKAGVSGTEFIGLILFVTLVPFVAIVSVINLIGLPFYMIKNKPQGKAMALCIASLTISVGLALFGAYSMYQLYTVPRKLSEESSQKFKAERQAFEADNAKPEISKEEAITLLQGCKLKGFYYTNQTDKSDPTNGGWGELSSTGVLLTKVKGEPYRISIADRLIPELVPIAREAQKKCSDPQFWHDGSFEQYKDGKWYFKGEVANDLNSGKSKDAALSLLRSCKVDYFVGYTSDVNVFKEANTKSWLEKAEKSTSGIEILEKSPQTYVFASKAMTVELQDTARSIRQSCYSQKKLYINIDSYVETEYPVGTWTRVKQ